MLSNTGLFLPMFCLFLWTVMMLIRSAALRVLAVRSGQVPLRFFEVFKGSEPPESIIRASNNINNLMQMPQLFYVICLFITLRPLQDSILSSCAWLYVIFRIGHSLVHISINKVPYRFAFFLCSMIMLGVLWIRTAILLCGS